MRAVFLDKDGTLVENVPYNVEPTRIQLCSGAEEGLRLLHEAGYGLIVVSNQSGVARGLYPETALQYVEAQVRRLLEAFNVPLAGFYYCPHHPDGTVLPYARRCGCRKPAPGLIRRAARDLGITYGRSWMIGDILDDTEAGHRAGCRTVLIRNGNETLWRVTPERIPDYITPDLAGAARFVLGE